MSHFCGLVILTPKYQKKHDLEDSLSAYSENLDVPEYSNGEVSDYEKVQFLCYYVKDYEESEEEMKRKFSESDVVREAGKTYGDYLADGNGGNRKSYYAWLFHYMSAEYAAFWLSMNPEAIGKFDKLYEENGETWNSNRWRVNYATGKWEEYSTYNPKSKWDWYDENGGRWQGCIKTKSGEFVDQCLLEEIDWEDFKPEDYEEEEKTDIFGHKYKPLKEGVKYHYTKSGVPFCLVVDGMWLEKGQMGFWGMTSNEKEDTDWTKEFFYVLDKLPKDSEVYNVDFHI